MWNISDAVDFFLALFTGLVAGALSIVLLVTYSNGSVPKFEGMLDRAYTVCEKYGEQPIAFDLGGEVECTGNITIKVFKGE